MQLTDELANDLVNMLQNGITVAIACEAVGISVSTYYTWLEYGAEAKPDSKFWKFRKWVCQARALCEINLVSIIQKHAPKDWKAAAWLLERMFGERYGKRVEQTVTTPEDKPIICMLPPVITTPRGQPILWPNPKGANLPPQK